jgi:hypothetical protein
VPARVSLAVSRARLPGGASAREDPCLAERISPRSPRVLEAQQHGEHPFELAVEMDLITAELFQLAAAQRLAECLLADQGPHSGVDQDVPLIR